MAPGKKIIYKKVLATWGLVAEVGKRVDSIPQKVAENFEAKTITEEEGRWAKVGHALNVTLLSAMQTYLEPELQTMFDNLPRTDGYLMATNGDKLKIDPDNDPDGVKLNFKALPQHTDKKNTPIVITSVQDLARLYTPEYTKKVQNFSIGTADSSSILHILGKASCFPQPLRDAAAVIREQVRNSWAHADIPQWDQAKFDAAFADLEKLATMLPNSATLIADLVYKESVQKLAEMIKVISEITIPTNVLDDISKTREIVTKMGQIFITEMNKELLHVMENSKTIIEAQGVMLMEHSKNIADAQTEDIISILDARDRKTREHEIKRREEEIKRHYIADARTRETIRIWREEEINYRKESEKRTTDLEAKMLLQSSFKIEKSYNDPNVDDYNINGATILHQACMVKILQEGLQEELGYNINLVGGMAELSSSTLKIPDIDINAKFHLHSDWVKVKKASRFNSCYTIQVMPSAIENVNEQVLKMQFHGLEETSLEKEIFLSKTFVLGEGGRGSFISSDITKWQLLGVIRSMKEWGLEISDSSELVLRASEVGLLNRVTADIDYDGMICKRAFLYKEKLENAFYRKLGSSGDLPPIFNQLKDLAMCFFPDSGIQVDYTAAFHINEDAVPEEAKQWTKRSGEWPSQDLIRYILRQGVSLVPASVPDNGGKRKDGDNRQMWWTITHDLNSIITDKEYSNNIDTTRILIILKDMKTGLDEISQCSHLFKSHFLKNALAWAMWKKQKERGHLTNRDLLLCTLGELMVAFESHCLKDFFNSDINILHASLSRYKEVVKKDFSKKIQGIVNDLNKAIYNLDEVLLTLKEWQKVFTGNEEEKILLNLNNSGVASQIGRLDIFVDYVDFLTEYLKLNNVSMINMEQIFNWIIKCYSNRLNVVWPDLESEEADKISNGVEETYTEAVKWNPVETPAFIENYITSMRMKNSLWVGNLDPCVTEATLFEKFSSIGPVLSIRVCRDRITRRSLGYAYVNYQFSADARGALRVFNDEELKGKTMHIKWAERRLWAKTVDNCQ